MTDKLRAGAPFDEGNIFNIPATDAGSIVNEYPDSYFVSIDAGTFANPIAVNIDGGTIPLKGTATYDPNKVYTEDDVFTGSSEAFIEDDITTVNQVTDEPAVGSTDGSVDPYYWILNWNPRVYRPGYIVSENPLITIDGSIPPALGDKP